jgi:hypothetical protein
MLTNGIVNYNVSLRGAALGNIPILDDSQETYLSQNQNALNMALLTDVASIGGGFVMAGASGGMGAAIGGGMAASGITGLLNTHANISDLGNIATNPVAFLGSALAVQFSGQFWVVTTRSRVTNADIVHTAFGYPYNMIDALTFPAAGLFLLRGAWYQVTAMSRPGLLMK